MNSPDNKVNEDGKIKCEECGTKYKKKHKCNDKTKLFYQQVIKQNKNLKFIE